MIIFVGDCHGDFRELKALAKGYPPKDIAGIFFLGDQTPNQPLEKELAPLGQELLAKTWFILGNHDSDHPRYMRNHLGMWDRHLHSRVITVEGMRIGGISGIFRKDIWYPPHKALWQDRASLKQHVLARGQELFEDQLPLEHWTTIFPEDLAAAGEPLDILLVHEAPSSHPHGFEVLDCFARKRGVQWIMHGHHHEDTMGTIAPGIRVVGLGLCQCMAWDASMLAVR